MAKNFSSLIVIPLENGVFIKISDSPYPRNLEISDLQKGLVLSVNGSDLIEEGAGLGSPVIKYRDKTYFSKTAKVKVEKESDKINKVTKEFLMDSISLKQFQGNRWINDSIYHPVHRLFTLFYLKLKPLRPAFNLMISARKKMGIETKFVRTKPRGVVEVIYEIRKSMIEINVDISRLNKENLEEVVILNEQGASQFPLYSDSDGLYLLKEKIGAWDIVEADSAKLISEQGLCYSQEKLDGAYLIRGWEKIENRHSWSGLNYIMKPTRNNFRYKIIISKNI
jgi:hypothetical protein